MSVHLLPFAASLNSETRTGKIDTRAKVLKLLLDYIDASPEKRFKIMTLPSVYWIFESALFQHLVKKYNASKAVTLHSFERDWDLFCLAALQIPKSYSNGIQQVMEERLNYQKVKSAYVNNYINIHNTDVFNYLEHTDNEFDFMWLDLTSPIDVVQDQIIHAQYKLSEHGLLVLSFSKGREKRTKITDRVQFVVDRLPSMELIELFEYRDTVTMVNLVLKKKDNTFIH